MLTMGSPADLQGWLQVRCCFSKSAGAGLPVAAVWRPAVHHVNDGHPAVAWLWVGETAFDARYFIVGP